MSAIRDEDDLPDDLLARLSTTQQKHWERSKEYQKRAREHRREAAQCLIVTWDEAERRALEAARSDHVELDMIVDPREGTAAIVEWDNPEAYIETDDTATRSVVQ